ncbi:MAG: sce7726 family protein [Nitrospirae bacterium]|nr:sce7726 family protein [Nitrospirota bacterium]
MRDIDIRKVLLKSFRRQYKNDTDTLLIPELGLCQGNARVDLAVVNGLIHGYEIKSERDTLNRLAGQQDIYNKVLDCVTVVAGSCHLLKIKKRVPSWWGISEAKFKNKKLTIIEVRPCKKNASVNPSALVQLLWRDEALSILKQRNLHRGVVSKPRNLIWGRLVECLSLEELRFEVRQKIKERQHWRSAKKQEPSGD